MCGIAGFVGRGDLGILTKMTDGLSHRGPDDRTFWVDRKRSVYFGHRRLSIIDLSGGAQPMFSIDKKLVITYNGEIYNHRELRNELIGLGYVFKTDHSDTEVLLNAYKAWGVKMTKRLNGMWAFVIYDIGQQKLFCSRDRFGEKPFFYTMQNGLFVFASELSAVVKHSYVKAKMSKKSLQKYFAYGYIPAPLTVFEGIYKLPAGCSLLLDSLTLNFSVKSYWNFELLPITKIPKNPEEEWGGQILYLLEKSVKERLIADVPLGVFLSGGMDSSAIVALAAKNLPKGSLKTFSIGFDESSFDESSYSNKIAELFNTDHHHQVLSLDTARRILPRVVSMLDEPMGDSSLIPTYLLAKFARKHVTVALGGDGGDELLGGYDPFKVLSFAKIYQKFMPKKVHPAIEIALSVFPVSHGNMSLDFKIKRTLRGLAYPPQFWSAVWMAPLSPKELEELFLEPIDLEDVYSEAIETWEKCKQDNIVDKVLQFYTKIYLQDNILVKVDRASMMNSLEVRAPFLDMELVDFIRRIPWQYKVGNRQTKYIFKKALEKVLPKEILYRSKKGFGMPIGKWFRDGSLDIGGKFPKYLNMGYADKLKSQHLNNRSDQRAFLWNLRVLNGMKCSKNDFYADL